MISDKTLKVLEFDKILIEVSKYAVLDGTKGLILNSFPETEYDNVLSLLKKTKESYDLLYKYSIGGVYYFDDVTEELSRADKNGTLNNAELLKIAGNLKSARILKTSISSVSDIDITIIPEIASRLYINKEFEDEITSKILSEDTISDNASNALYHIRKQIKNLNAKIREQLNSFVHGNLNKYLQDAVVTMRQDRYVIPVKSEYRSYVKGFIHDQSSSGATVFIEPEIIIELNNELKKATFDEKEEVYKILSELSNKVSYMSDAIRSNLQNITDIDLTFAKAQYSFYNKCNMPEINKNGIVNIKRGRHPLIDKQRVVPIDVEFGENYNFLLVTGPNTGGKTVTLKLIGLFVLMISVGLFIPASSDTIISTFNNVFCDIGDEQSIEQNLSTFSSHVKNLINILNNVDKNSLVLIDEIGAGTDPEEGSALALAIINKLLNQNCFGIITTHYARLKEFAMESNKIENASMEFDGATLKPLYKLNIGIPGSSNAIEIAKVLGLESKIIDEALLYLSDNKITFEKVLKKAEETRRQAEMLSNQLILIKNQKEEELETILLEKEKIVKERERIYNSARQEIKRIISDRVSDAEDIIVEIKNIAKKSNIESKDVFKASELKNRLINSRYLNNNNQNSPIELIKPKISELSIGDKVYIKSLNSYGKIINLNLRKSEAQILIGNIKSVVKLDDIYNKHKTTSENNIKIVRHIDNFQCDSSINVVGKNSLEALEEVQLFIDRSVVNGLDEIKIIHGVGQGILLKEIRQYLTKDKNVISYRKGKYGEGENGVTIVKLR